MKPGKTPTTLQESSIRSAIDRLTNPKDEKSVRALVNSLLSEAAGIPEAGDNVAVIDDPVYGITGARGKVKGQTRNKSGFVDVEMENGTVVPCMSMLLVKV